MAMYSYSKFGCFNNCKLMFKYKYIDKIKTGIQSIEAVLGSCVHGALEWFYQVILGGSTPTVEELVAKYIEKWEKMYNDDVLIVKKEFPHGRF